MTATREAIVLPASFLTVALLGGVRLGLGHGITLVPPPLISLVLAVVLMVCLVRASVVAPQAVLSAERSTLENLSGLTVLVTLFAASTQVFTLVTPEQGLLHAVFAICFFIQLTTTLAGVKGRRNMLRSLAVLLGSAFVVRFVVLEGLYTRNGSLAKRIFTAVVEGASLGSIQYAPVGAATGYVAFFTLALFFIGLVLLPRGGARGWLRPHTVRDLRGPITAVVLVVALGSAGCGRSTPAETADASSPVPDTRVVTRNEALAKARVWTTPAVPISQFDFAQNPRDGFELSDDVSCRFVVQKLNGRTQKFHCQLADGRIVKIKYGKRNAELPAEVAGTRLLRALGFGADDMFIVKTVRCEGCPPFPFQSLQCHEYLALEWPCFGGPFRGTGVRTFTTAVIERRLNGTAIESFDGQGWSWYELDRVDPSRGGASRAEIDALRLLAVFLAHWDNKAENQRLVCPSGRELADGGCTSPIAMIQDLGATFGPFRGDLLSWRSVRVWRDRGRCTVDMSNLPYGGGTFPERAISEAGRLMLGGLLEQLSPSQLRDLFTASRMTVQDVPDAESRNADAWVGAFLDKVREIRTAGPCSS